MEANGSDLGNKALTALAFKLSVTQILVSEFFFVFVRVRDRVRVKVWVTFFVVVFCCCRFCYCLLGFCHFCAFFIAHFFRFCCCRCFCSFCFNSQTQVANDNFFSQYDDAIIPNMLHGMFLVNDSIHEVSFAFVLTFLA